MHSHGYYGNNGPHPPRPLWLTSYLRRHGYQTAMIGKAHYGFNKTEQEFDYVRLCDRIDTPPANPLRNDYFRMLVERGLADERDDATAARVGQNVPFRSHLPADLSVESWTADTAISYLRNRDPNRPFFAFVSFQRPHAPITPPAPYDTMYRPSDVQLPPSANESLAGKPEEQLKAARRSTYPYHPNDPDNLRAIIAMYFGLISLTDASIGRILAELDAQNLTKDTLIFFTADHGDFSGEHGFFHKNLGMYECIHHIPFLVAGPGIEGGQVRDQLVQQTDIFPTVCDVAGLPVPDSVQGLSLMPIAKGNPAAWPRTAAFGEAENRKCIRTLRYRMVFDPVGNANELYDHSNDPWEMHNRYDDPSCRDVRLELGEEFLRFYARTEKQTIATSLARNGGGGGGANGAMPPGPTFDLWWRNLEWPQVKKQYRL